MTRILVSRIFALSLATLGCAVRTTRSTAGTPRIESAKQTVLRLPENDNRRLLVGRWLVEFRWEQRRRSLLGTLELRDSLVHEFAAQGVRSLLVADFEKAFGWSPSCVEPTRGILGVALTGSEVEFDFSPWCRDDKLIVRRTLRGQEIVGRWTMVRFAGAGPERGTFRMWRDGSMPVNSRDDG